jgi:hypothetical protein
MVSWAPAGARKLVALDAAGRLHSLRFEATKWVQADYLESSIAPTPLMTCAFDEAASHVYLYNGATTVCVALGPDGKFRERIEPQMACSFDGPVVRANRAGVCIASTKAGQAIMAGVPKGAELGAIKPDAPVPFAIAPITRRAAILGSDMRLSAMSVNGDGLRKTAPNYSPILHAPPTSLVWSRRGEFLVATFADDTWKVFKPLGLQA